jgi:hypothetical protein
MHSLSGLAIVMLATLTLGAAIGAYAVWLFCSCPPSYGTGDVGHLSVDHVCTLIGMISCRTRNLRTDR